jgi:hypothetical protein
VNREQECKQIVDTYVGFERINELLDAQFHALHQRAQVLLGICGVLLTASVMLTTGKVIARPDLPHLRLASHLIIAAGVSDILAAAIAVVGVLRIHWVVPPSTDLHAWLMSRLAYRDHKTRVFHTSIALLLFSMVLYQAGASIVLARL